MEKTYFSRKYLEESDILLIFAAEYQTNNANPKNYYCLLQFYHVT